MLILLQMMIAQQEADFGFRISECQPSRRTGHGAVGRKFKTQNSKLKIENGGPEGPPKRV
jgi:hypothetical protein